MALSIAVPILVFKLNLDKLLSRYEEGVPEPNPNKYILFFTFQLWVFIIIGGLAYTVILNLKSQEITPINLSRFYHIPFLTWGNYLAFVVNYLSFRYFLSKSKEDSQLASLLFYLLRLFIKSNSLKSCIKDSKNAVI